MTIEIKGKFPIEFGKEYYTVEVNMQEKKEPCKCCNHTGKISICGDEYTCPRCYGNWKDAELVGMKPVYHIERWVLDSVSVDNFDGVKIYFRQVRFGDWRSKLEMQESDLKDMTFTRRGDVRHKLYDDYNVARKEVKRLNAEEKKKQE